MCTLDWMRQCKRSGNRNGGRLQLVELPQATPLLVVSDRSGWRCWLGVGETARRGPSTVGSYRFHPRPSPYRDRSRLGHQLGVRSSCRSSASSAARVTQVARTPSDRVTCPVSSARTSRSLSTGLTGSKDDPIHTRPADGPQQPPQGSATSAARHDRGDGCPIYGDRMTV